jgi:hypothetical protein
VAVATLLGPRHRSRATHPKTPEPIFCPTEMFAADQTGGAPRDTTPRHRDRDTPRKFFLSKNRTRDSTWVGGGGGHNTRTHSVTEYFRSGHSVRFGEITQHDDESGRRR